MSDSLMTGSGKETNTPGFWRLMAGKAFDLPGISYPRRIHDCAARGLRN
jgi:hypothetical protein